MLPEYLVSYSLLGVTQQCVKTSPLSLGAGSLAVCRQLLYFASDGSAIPK